MVWEMFNGTNPEVLGFIPDFLNDKISHSAKEQMAYYYGWSPFGADKFKIVPVAGIPELRYPGDPAMKLMARAVLRDEQILIFEGGPWMAIVQQDGSFEVSRID